MTITAFSGTVHVHYRFLYLAGDVVDDPDFGVQGQANGLCGAGVAGQLSFITGLHTGELPVEVTWHESEPALTDAWEDVVEVPFDVPSTSLWFSAFEEFHEIEIGAAGPHRVRYCASGMDAGNLMDTPGPGESAPDRYAIQLWPAEHRPDEIVRRTSRHADYWHSTATESH